MMEIKRAERRLAAAGPAGGDGIDDVGDLLHHAAIGQRTIQGHVGGPWRGQVADQFIRGDILHHPVHPHAPPDPDDKAAGGHPTQGVGGGRPAHPGQGQHIRRREDPQPVVPDHAQEVRGGAAHGRTAVSASATSSRSRAKASGSR